MHSDGLEIGDRGGEPSNHTGLSCVCECVRALGKESSPNELISNLSYNMSRLDDWHFLLVTRALTHAHNMEVDHGQG